MARTPTAVGKAINRPPRVFISVAEPSADQHGASLIRAFRQLRPGTTFLGLAGPNMQAVGCQAIEDVASRSAMLLGAAGSAWRAFGLLSRVDRCLATGRFDAAVFIDSPVLNLPLARRAKARRIPVLYYVAPQVWAWAEFRWRKIRDRVDQLAVILPFEEAYFRKRGIPARYVGHPLFDALEGKSVDKDRVAQLRGGASRVLGLLPGSRRHVVEEVLPGQLEVAREVQHRWRDARVLISVANDRVAPSIHRLVRRAGVRVELLAGANAELITASELVLVASGTATLEVAYHNKPMIVMYNHSRLGYELIGRWFIATRHLCLLNILAGREVVPEFMPYYRSVRPIAGRAVELLATPQSRQRMSTELRELMAPIIRTGASRNTAMLLKDLIESHPEGQSPKRSWTRHIW